MAATMASTFALSRPSEKLGTLWTSVDMRFKSIAAEVGDSQERFLRVRLRCLCDLERALVRRRVYALHGERSQLTMPRGWATRRPDARRAGAGPHGVHRVCRRGKRRVLEAEAETQGNELGGHRGLDALVTRLDEPGLSARHHEVHTRTRL